MLRVAGWIAIAPAALTLVITTLRRTQLWREPIVHFLLAGAVLFTLYTLIRGPAPAPADARTIIVDRPTLLRYLQYQANAFEPKTFATALDVLSPTELQRLIDAYVEDEIKLREAESLGLAESDFVIRQRMIQKIDFLLGDVATDSVTIDEQELGAYFETHIERYAIEPTVTFTHVFFDLDRRGVEQAAADAAEAIETLNRAATGFNDTTVDGDRFPFLRNYVERTLDYVASHFGTEFAAALGALSPSASNWQGPIRSAYGQHAVLITQRTPKTYPTLDEVRTLVERDLIDARAANERKRIVAELRQRYRVEVLDLRAER